VRALYIFQSLDAAGFGSSAYTLLVAPKSSFWWNYNCSAHALVRPYAVRSSVHPPFKYWVL
jgi:hypothetical protein